MMIFFFKHFNGSSTPTLLLLVYSAANALFFLIKFNLLQLATIGINANVYIRGVVAIPILRSFVRFQFYFFRFYFLTTYNGYSSIA